MPDGNVVTHFDLFRAITGSFRIPVTNDPKLISKSRKAEVHKTHCIPNPVPKFIYQFRSTADGFEVTALFAQIKPKWP